MARVGVGREPMQRASPEECITCSGLRPCALLHCPMQTGLGLGASPPCGLTPPAPARCGLAGWDGAPLPFSLLQQRGGWGMRKGWAWGRSHQGRVV